MEGARGGGGAGVAAAVAGILFLQWRGTSGRLSEAELYLPLEKDLEVLQMRFYQPNFRLESKEDFEEVIAKIEAQMKRTGAGAQGHYLIGRVREVTAEFDAADTAYGAALALRPEHAASLLARGRLTIERALMARAGAGKHEERARSAEEGAQSGLELVKRGVALAGTEAEMARDVAEAYAWCIGPRANRQ